MSGGGGEKTEQPTPKRLRDARQKGQVAFSREVSSAAILVVLFTYIGATWNFTMDQLRGLIDEVSRLNGPDFQSMLDQALMDTFLVIFKLSVPPVALAALVGIAAGFFQVGAIFAFESIKPDLNKINPAEGIKKIFSKKNLVELLKNLVKVGFISTLLYIVIKQFMPDLVKLSCEGVDMILPATAAMPPLSQITDAQITQVQERVGADAASQLSSLRDKYGTPDVPVLDPSSVDFGDGSELALLLMTLNTKITELQAKSAQEGIQTQKEGLKSKNDENLKKIQDAIDKIKDQKNSGLLAKIFGWIGMAFALIAAVAAPVVTGGAASAVVGLVIVGIGLALMVAQETGGMQALMDVMFGDNETAKMIFMIALQVAMLAVSIAAMVCSGGASAANVATNIVKIGNIIRGVSMIVGGAASVAGGAAGIAAGVQGYEASQAMADSKELQAWIAKLQAQLEEEQETLKKILDQMQQGAQVAIDMLNGIAQTKGQILQMTVA